MLPNNFIFSQAESLFQSKLDSNEIKNEAIAFMADTGRIWTHGTWFATPLTAEDIKNLIEGSTTLVEYIQTLSPAEVSVSDTQPSGEEKIWVNGNSISFKTGDSWSTPIDFDNFLSKDNTLEYTPAGDYNPATKKYVDDQITKRDNVLIIDYTDLVGSPIDETVVSNIIKAAQEGKAVILKAENNLFNVTVGYTEASNTLELDIYTITPQENGYDLSIQSIIINTLDNTLTSNTSKAFTLVNTGDGLKYLSDDGTYKTFPDMATVVELNSAVLALTNESSSEDIIAAFDSATQFSNLILQIRDSDNIVNEVLLDTDGYIGHINASLAVSKTDEIIHIRFIDNADKLVLMKITNTDGTFSCVRTEKDLVNDPVELVNSGDGTKFLADDGTYKEAGDKTNVLILSLEDDLANGQKDSPVDAEVSTALKDAISNGKACVIKSANSDILANLQQIGNNVTIVMEQISRVGQTFVAVNTTITVNTSTNVISDYQTGAIVLETEGDGSKFLSDDGTYKEIKSADDYIVNINDLIIAIRRTDNGNTVDLSSYQDLINNHLAYSNHTPILIDNYGNNYIFARTQSGGYDGLHFAQIAIGSTGGLTFMHIYRANINNLSAAVVNKETIRFEGGGDGTRFLSDDGYYKEINTNNAYLLNADIFSKGSTGSIDSSIVQQLDNAINNKIPIYFYTPDADTNNNRFYPISVRQSSEDLANNIILTYLISNTIIQDIIISRANNTYEIQSVFLITENDVLTKTNTTAYTPTASYHPATKKYVDDISTAAVYASNININTIGTDVNGNCTVQLDNKNIWITTILSIPGISEAVYLISPLFHDTIGYQLIPSPVTYKLDNGDLVQVELESNGEETSGQIQINITAHSKYIQRILTESEYTALGGSTASDNVLYFITPD